MFVDCQKMINKYEDYFVQGVITMGRPLKKTFFNNPDEDGVQLCVSNAWIPGATKATTKNKAWVVRQISKHRFVITDGTDTGIVNLQAEPITAEGQARIEVKPFGGGTQYVSQLNNRTVKTFEGNVFSYIPAQTASVAGEATVLFR